MTTPARKTAARKAPVKRAQPYKPAGVRQPEDHKPPAQSEAEGDQYVEWEHNGITYVALGPDYVKGVAPLAERGLGTRALEKLLGAEQFKTFQATEPYDREYGEMFDKWAAAAGLENMGN